MTENEALRFIQDELLQTYPNWDMGDREAKIWCEELQDFDLVVAKKALRNYYVSEKAGYRKPKMWDILKTCRKLQQERTPKAMRLGPVVAFIVKRMDDKKDERRYYCNYDSIPLDDVAIKEAGRMAKEHEQVYGGRWIGELEHESR